jgi:hypothetical protein
MLGVQGLDDRRAHLTGADDEDPHAAWRLTRGIG